jgi:rhodanese-related sulfurtransferase
MSPNSASRAEKLGYTNVKVYHDGVPVWTKQHHLVISPRSLKEGWMDKGMPAVLIDVRSLAEAEQGFIKGAVTLPAAEVATNLDKFPPKAKKPPIILYDRNGSDDAKTAARALVAAGYPVVDVLTGGFEAWKAASYPVESGALATTIVYVPKPRQGEMSAEEFRKIATAMKRKPG